MPVSGVQNLLKMGVAILAIFPGLAVYISLAEVPPDFVGTAQIISFSLSILAVMCILLYSKRLARFQLKSVVIGAFLFLFLGVASLMFYTDFARSHVVVDYWTDAPAEKESDLPRRIMPLDPPQDIVDLLDQHGSAGRNEKERYQLSFEGLSKEDAELLRTRMGEESLTSYTLMVILLLLSQVLLIAPPVAVATRLVAGEAQASHKDDRPDE